MKNVTASEIGLVSFTNSCQSPSTPATVFQPATSLVVEITTEQEEFQVLPRPILFFVQLFEQRWVSRLRWTITGNSARSLVRPQSLFFRSDVKLSFSSLEPARHSVTSWESPRRHAEKWIEHKLISFVAIVCLLTATAASEKKIKVYRTRAATLPPLSQWNPIFTFHILQSLLKKSTTEPENSSVSRSNVSTDAMSLNALLDNVSCDSFSVQNSPPSMAHRGFQGSSLTKLLAELNSPELSIDEVGD